MSRSHDAVFQEWKASNPSISWEEYQVDQNTKLLNRYDELGFKVIRLTEKSKRPIDPDWPNLEISWLRLFAHLSNKGNIGVVAGTSKPKYIMFDWQGGLEPLGGKVDTLTAITPNGYHFFTLDAGYSKVSNGKKFEAKIDALKKKFPDNMDVSRAGNGYVVVPPSCTCMDEHSKHLCEEEKRPHRYRMHEWQNLNANIMTFSEFARSLLK